MTVEIDESPHFSIDCCISQLTEQDFQSLADQLRHHGQIVVSFSFSQWIQLYPSSRVPQRGNEQDEFLKGLQQYVTNAKLAGPGFAWVTSRDCSDFKGVSEEFRCQMTIEL